MLKVATEDEARVYIHIDGLIAPLLCPRKVGGTANWHTPEDLRTACRWFMDTWMTLRIRR